MQFPRLVPLELQNLHDLRMQSPCAFGSGCTRAWGGADAQALTVAQGEEAWASCGLDGHRNITRSKWIVKKISPSWEVI